MNLYPPPAKHLNQFAPQASIDLLSQRLGRAAVASLHAELVLAPKPGLVTPFDTGSHSDMNAATFMRSLFALRSYFIAIAKSGYRHAEFVELNSLGRQAEAQMLRATGGINTHRGAIFSLGLLTASVAAFRSDNISRPSGEAVCEEVGRRWGNALHKAPFNPDSNGQRVVRRYGGGACVEAANGFPVLREVALPSLRTNLTSGLNTESALVQTFMQLVAELDDTNLLHRGGQRGLVFAKDRANEFLMNGGCHANDWQVRLSKISSAFVAKRLSPGGSADLLACAWFLIQQEAR